MMSSKAALRVGRPGGHTTGGGAVEASGVADAAGASASAPPVQCMLIDESRGAHIGATKCPRTVSGGRSPSGSNVSSKLPRTIAPTSASVIVPPVVRSAPESWHASSTR